MIKSKQWLWANLLVNMRLKKWLAAANTTLCAGKYFPWTTRVTSQRVPWGESAQNHNQCHHTRPPVWYCLFLTHTHTCFLRLFIIPMMLESCLYSSLLTHFLSLFFLEHDAFSAGEATPVMLSGLFLNCSLKLDCSALITVGGMRLRAPLLLNLTLLTLSYCDLWNKIHRFDP